MDNPNARRRGRTLCRSIGPLAAAVWLSGCASSSITQSGGLSSYQDMTAVKTARTKARIFADADALAAAKSVRIEAVTYGSGAADEVSADQRALIANLVERTLCVRLSSRFDIVAGQEPADLTIHAVITRLTPTNREAAAATVPIRAVSIAFGVPAPFRVPIGMGSFAAEGEADDQTGGRRASMVWARGADVLTSQARVSKIGDAYQLSDAFAGDMAALVITARNPLHDLPKAPFGGRGRPVAQACDAYGKSHGAERFVGGVFGAPPEWAEGKPPPAAAPRVEPPDLTAAPSPAPR
jgi:hypothetical protein